MALIRGDVVYRVLHPIERRVPTNVGLLDAVSRGRRLSMHVGADVLAGFGPEAAQKSKTNIFAYGYAFGRRVSFGASRKGRIWSYRVARSLLDWVTWAELVGQLITDDSISIESVMEGFIIPIAATERPDLVPLGIEWPYALIASTSEARQVEYQQERYPLLDLDLAVTAWSTEGPIRFEVRSPTWSVPYELSFREDGPVIVPGSHGDAHILLRSGPSPLSTFMSDNGMTVFFDQEAVLSPDGFLIQPNRDRPSFDSSWLEVVDWTGVDIRKESQGANRDPDSVQYRVIGTLMGESDWEVVLDDDGTGEIADVVCLRREGRTLRVVLAHCKYSHEDKPGARLADLYELCGQATKSHKARAEIELILRKLLRRERGRARSGRSGFVVGGAPELHSILSEARLLDVDVTVVIAQPGVSQGLISAPMSELLGCTQLYLRQTYESGFRVLCSA